MYFYLQGGKQTLDLSGNFILSRNKDLISTRSKSAGPRRLVKAKYIPNMMQLTFIGKIKATIAVIQYIWKSDY